MMKSGFTLARMMMVVAVAIGFLFMAPITDVIGNEMVNNNDDGARALTYDGYTLFAPNGKTNTYLIDMDGTTVHSWSHTRSGGYSTYLLEDGLLLRPAQDRTAQLNGGASAGYIQKIDWDGNVVWEYKYSTSTLLAHHDIEPMPNGNVLAIAWEVKSTSEATAAGYQRSQELWPDHVIEIEPVGSSGGNIVWEWHAWDHLIQDNDPTKNNYGVVEDHPELLDLNMGLSSTRPPPGQSNDWLHTNGISYNPDLDQVVISSHTMNEIYVIDHSTNTAEAAGHSGGQYGKGGDILYRWGYPSNYDATGSDYLDVVHCSWWVPSGMPGAGNILIFNNGEGRRYSEVVEISPPMDETGNYSFTSGSPYGPTSPTWTYEDGTNFYSNHLGSCQRLPNGNTLISESTSGDLFEVTSSGSTVWTYSYTQEIARSLRYAANYSGLSELFPESPPVADAGEDQIVHTGDEVTLDGSLSSDAQDDTSSLTFDWNVSVGNPDAVTLSDESAISPTFTAPETTGDYFFTLVVQDTDGDWSVEDEVKISVVLPPNSKPTADAGPDTEALPETNVTLSGSASSDPEDDITSLIFDWNVSSGNPDIVVLSDETAIMPTLTTPETTGDYYFTLTVMDTRGAWSAEDSVKVTVTATPNINPVADAGPDQVITLGDLVTLNGSLSYDPDGSIVTWEWSCPSDDTVVFIDGNSSSPSFSPPQADEYIIRMRVMDDHHAWSSMDQVNISVNLPSNIPPVADAGNNISIFLGDTVYLNGSGSYDPDGNITEWNWMCTSHAGIEMSDSNSSKPFFIPGEAGVYLVSLSVNDDRGSTSNEDLITVTVEELPVVIEKVFPTIGPFLYENGTAVENATITLVSSTGVAYTAITDEEGYATFEAGVYPDTFQCQISIDGELLVDAFGLEIDEEGWVILPVGGIPNVPVDEEEIIDTVEEPEEEGQKDETNWLPMIIAILVASLIVMVSVGLILVRRRRRSFEEE